MEFAMGKMEEKKEKLEKITNNLRLYIEKNDLRKNEIAEKTKIGGYFNQLISKNNPKPINAEHLFDIKAVYPEIDLNEIFTGQSSPPTDESLKNEITLLNAIIVDQTKTIKQQKNRLMKFESTTKSHMKEIVDLIKKMKKLQNKEAAQKLSAELTQVVQQCEKAINNLMHGEKAN